jgi:hypothetical protein
MPRNAFVTVADLGPKVAALTCQIEGRPAAVINSAARDDPAMRAHAACALVSIGLDAGSIMGALNGIRS